ncbi:hypothetical protein [Hydrogenophaga defluvii]|uniref:YcxB-like protein n=1 Tax=Hydrogenophaga defluvii TaxID=249410 RepID=A0ABW2SE92_9BURK
MPRYVTLGTVRPLGWVTLVGFLIAAVWALRAGEPWPALGFAAFALLGVYLLIGAYGRYAVEDDSLHSITPLGWQYRMSWAEVKYVEFGTGGTLVFFGDGKRFVLPPAAFWSGEHKPEMYKRLVQLIEAHSLTPVPSNTADYRFNRNVRVQGEASQKDRPSD